jgi:hypothetical protein
LEIERREEKRGEEKRRLATSGARTEATSGSAGAISSGLREINK